MDAGTGTDAAVARTGHAFGREPAYRPLLFSVSGLRCGRFQQTLGGPSYTISPTGLPLRSRGMEMMTSVTYS